MKKLKLVVIGDSDSGKSSLIKRFVHKTFSEEYQASMFDTYYKDLIFEDKTYTLEITDVGGTSDFKDTRAQAYPGTDIVMMCY